MNYPERIQGSILVGQNKSNAAYFNAASQTYTVYSDGKLIVKDKYSFKDIKQYIE